MGGRAWAGEQGKTVKVTVMRLETYFISMFE